MTDDKIVIRGAREHNLKNIDVTLPRNKLVVISGLRRAYVDEYLSPEEDVTEAIVREIPIEDIPNNVVLGTIRKLYRELEQYTKNVPYISNGLLALIANTNDINKLTDIVVTHISLDNKRLIDYIHHLSRKWMIMR